MVSSIVLISAILATGPVGPKDAASVCAVAESRQQGADAEASLERCDSYIGSLIDKAAKEMSAAELEGKFTACAMQRYVQAKMFKRLGKLTKAVEWLDRLPLELSDQKMQRSAQFQEDSGSFGACSEDWTLKLDASMDYIWEASGKGEKLPVYPSFLDSVNSPELLDKMFSRYLDPSGGLPARYREASLNNLTGLVAILYRGMLKEYGFHPELKSAMTKILDDKWQDPATGFWGVPVTKDGRTEILPNISITFHILGYRGGLVKRWPQIIDTILGMKDGEWPRGWKEDGRFSHHHLYDVVRFFNLGWPHMSAKQRERAAAELDEMLSVSVKRLLTPGYDFDDPNADEVAEAINYHVFFHDEIGSFGSKKAFWRKGRALDSVTRGRVIEALQARLSKFNIESSGELKRAQKILSAAAASGH